MKHPFTGSGDPGRSAEQGYMITAGVGGPNGAAMVAIPMTEKSGLAYRALRLTPTPRPVGRSVIGAAP
jgi:hypothetical protein